MRIEVEVIDAGTKTTILVDNLAQAHKHLCNHLKRGCRYITTRYTILSWL